jgi:DNA-directed RNA polymerase subunit RPC12/RpoP
MTNEEVKKMLKAKLECLKNETSGINYDCNMRLCDGCSLNYEQGNIGEQEEALEIAIKALEEEPQEDCISRNECLDTINELLAPYIPKMMQFTLPLDLARAINKLPSVKPQRAKGHWIEEEMFEGDVAYKCSKCGGLFELENGTPKDNEYNFCPKCGARMAESEDKE